MEALSKGINRKLYSGVGGSALYLAAIYKHDQNVEKLIDTGVLRSLCDIYGSQPHRRSSTGQNYLFGTLIYRDTNMTVRDDDEHICQRIAAINGRGNVVEIILDTDRDVAICNNDSYICLNIIDIKGRMNESMDDA